MHILSHHANCEVGEKGLILMSITIVFKVSFVIYDNKEDDNRRLICGQYFTHTCTMLILGYNKYFHKYLLPFGFVFCFLLNINILGFKSVFMLKKGEGHFGLKCQCFTMKNGLF